MLSKWYFTAAATRDYMRIARLRDDDGGPHWGRAEHELAAHIEAAKLVPGLHTISGAQIWRTGRVKAGDQPKSVRLEFTVSTSTRPEGDAPQLLRVRVK